MNLFFENMIDNLNIGTQNRADAVVGIENTAIAMGSGGLEVFATPAMIALMENAAFNLFKAAPYNEDSVGVLMNVALTRACKVGAKVYAVATVTAVEGRKITFEVKAFDEKGEIGSGIHERFVIDPCRFMSKL